MTKRKKYVDDLDIQLSDENRSGDEDSVVVDANDFVNGIPMDQPPRDIFVVFSFHFCIWLSSIHVGLLWNVEQCIFFVTPRVGRNHDLKKIKNHFYLNSFFDFLKIHIFEPSLYQIFETGLSAQSHKQHNCHASAISWYTLVEQKVSKRQLIKLLLPWLYI